MSTEFFEAIRAGDRDKVESLLLVNARLIHEKENGLGPVLVAAYHLEPQLAEFLADKTVALTVFEAAAIGRTPHLVRLLARNPDLVNAPASDGFRPLGLACFFGHLEAAEYLIRAGASVNMPSNNEPRVTPLHSAVSGHHASVVKMLLKNGALPNLRDPNGCTPLHTAAANGDVETIQILILHGADIHIRSNEDKLPAQLADEKGHQLAAEILKREITKRLRPTS